MNNLSTNQLILGSGVLSATGNILYYNQAGIISSAGGNTTGSVFVNQSFSLTPAITGQSFILSSKPFYINTGSGSNIIWTLPLISTCTGLMYGIKNRGNTITLTGTSTDLFFPLYPVNNFTINSGESYNLYNDGVYWNII